MISYRFIVALTVCMCLLPARGAFSSQKLLASLPASSGHDLAGMNLFSSDNIDEPAQQASSFSLPMQSLQSTPAESMPSTDEITTEQTSNPAELTPWHLEDIDEEETNALLKLHQEISAEQEKEPLFAEVEEKGDQQATMPFSFDNAQLSKIVTTYAKKRKVNLILPQGAQALNQQVTFKTKHKLPLNKAERYIQLFLAMAGYTMIMQEGYLRVIKVDTNINRTTLPLYINVPAEKLPRSDERIRYLYNLSTLRVPQSVSQTNEPLPLLLKDILSATGAFFFDTKSNSIILTDKANNIASVMTIISELDAVGSREVIEIIPLFNASAVTAAALLQQLIKVAVGSAQKNAAASETSAYFSPNTRVVADDRTNSLIVMGREPAVERVREFIREVLDAAQDSGKSILHTYDLQYLDAKTFADTLMSLINLQQGSTGQTATTRASGPERLLRGVLVIPETYQVSTTTQTAINLSGQQKQSQSMFGQSAPLTSTRGGNRLVIAARADDWLFVKDLIQQLDKPQPQVIIRVLIADITYNRTKAIASQTRNPSFLSLPSLSSNPVSDQGVNFQSAMAAAPALTGTTPATLATDLLQLLTNPTTGSTFSIASNPMSTGANAGSLIFSLNDSNGSGIWSVFQVLNQFADAKILSHPYLVTLNNVKAQEQLKVIRRLQGDATSGEGGALAQNVVDVEASLNVTCLPRISSRNRLNMQLIIDIEEFIGPATQSMSSPGANAAGARHSRHIQTSVNLGSGDVLILGGLTRLEENDSNSNTPLLGKIPIIGWFFRSSSKQIVRNNLAVFISPTIVEPRLRENQHIYTAEKVQAAYKDLGDTAVFDDTRDPISRSFFKSLGDSNLTMMDHYVADAKDTGLVKASVRGLRENPPTDFRKDKAEKKKKKERAVSSKKKSKTAHAAAEEALTLSSAEQRIINPQEAP
jgi:general secretion pathway protein D